MAKLNKSNKGIFGIILNCAILIACSNQKQEDRSIVTIDEPSLCGKWQMIDWNGEGKPYLDISLNFKNDGEYTDSRSEDAVWNYRYVEPDSVILYHHGVYEERYKILTLSSDTLIMELSESLFHAEDNGNEITDKYGNSECQIFKFIHK